MISAHYGHYELCQYLIKNKANVNAIDHHQWTPLLHAIRKSTYINSEIIIKIR